MSHWFNRFGGPAIFLAVAVLLWEVLVRVLNVRTFILPPPTLIVTDVVNLGQQFWQHLTTTLYEILVGFALAVVVGILLAIPIVYSRFLRNTIYPLILVLQTAPKVALAPLIVLWFGFGEISTIIVTFLVAFFPMVVNTATGLGTLNQEMLDLARIFRGSQLQVFAKIRFPNALPYVFSGLKISVTLAVVGAIVGEFVAASAGLGFLILVAAAELKTTLQFGSIIMLSLVGILLFAAVSLAEKLVAPWYLHEEREPIIPAF